MTRTTIAGAALAAVLGLGLILLAVAGSRHLGQDLARQSTSAGAAPSTASIPSDDGEGDEPSHEDYPGFLYGLVTTLDGTTYQGRLRFGGGEEAFWSDYFNGLKDTNPWAAHVPPERLKERRPIELFGVEIAHRERRIDLGRPFMARFGDIVRIEAGVRELRVALKSGTVFGLDRFDADDFADGLRVWDGERGVVNLAEWRIRSIELLPTPPLPATPDRLHGTVRTKQGDFTGFVQWDREDRVGSDELVGRTADGELRLPFDTVRSIERRSRDSARVTLTDGRQAVLSGSRQVGRGNRGVHVDDPRYGRVRVSWDAFERVDFGSGPCGPDGSGPGYGDFPPGRALTGSVTTRDGRRLVGRLVYDLDESETTETLDAPSRGIHYHLPFGLVASIALPGRERPGPRGATVRLHDGEELQLERSGDLGDGNAGMLIFVDRRERPEYVPWSQVERIDFDRPQPPRSPAAEAGPRRSVSPTEPGEPGRAPHRPRPLRARGRSARSRRG